MKRLAMLVIVFSMATTTAFAGHPLVTDDTGTQGKGNGQVELGVSFFWDKDKADEWTTLKSRGGEAMVNVAVGLFETLDFVVEVPYAWFKVEENSFPLEREDGLSDIAFDAKWRFFEKDGWSMALKPGISVPSGNEEKGLGAGRAGYRLFFIFIKEFEPVAVHANLGYIRNENKFGERLDLWHASIAAEVEILSGLKLMANFGAERNPDPGSNNHPAFALGGVSYDVSERITLDAGVKYGLTSTEDDWTALGGLTITF